ncbi:hypothetical protein G7054_g11901 [Neopestalotiopsis clavispora]|nr:hypothetical protein G7054_g11901 [Neopestalotiopsis clavispora]
MATADPSQSALAGTANKPPRAQSPPAQSKRERKKQLIYEKLAALERDMSRDRDRTYREELQKIQADVHLVSRVDPYADRPLDEIDRDLQELSQANANGTDRPTRTLLEMAGPSFQEWVEHVKDMLEVRDYELTSQKHEHEARTIMHRNTYAYKVEVAKREHKALSATLKDRLMNAITSKKLRLNREKEALDVAESTVLFLHPNQYTLTNPASPGGTHSKRATRLRRDADDVSGLSDKKRKRNGAEDDGSPAPIRRALDASATTPLWQNDRLRAARRETGPIYSIEKLFTDKELSMNYNTAAIAAYKHLLTRRDNAGNPLSSPEESEAGNGELNGDEKEDLAAPAMERAPSHQTRSTRNLGQNWFDDKVLGVEGLANFELAGNLEKMDAQEPRLPPLIHSQYSKAYVKSESNTPTSLNQDDVHQDMQIMNVFKAYERAKGAGANIDTPNGGRRLLENMIPAQRNGRPFAALIQGQPRPVPENIADTLGVNASALRDEPAPSVLGTLAPGATVSNKDSPVAPPMSRQSSFGGVAMSRSGSGRGRRRG